MLADAWELACKGEHQPPSQHGSRCQSWGKICCGTSSTLIKFQAELMPMLPQLKRRGNPLWPSQIGSCGLVLDVAHAICMVCSLGRQCAGDHLWRWEGATAPAGPCNRQPWDVLRPAAFPGHRSLVLSLKLCPCLCPLRWVIQRGVRRDSPVGTSQMPPLPGAGPDLSLSVVVETPVRKKQNSLSPPSMSGSSGKRKRKIQLLSSRRGDQLALVRRCLAAPFALLWR